MLFRVSFNPDILLWKIQPQQGGDRVLASRIILDAPAKTNGAFLEVDNCVLTAEGVEQVGQRTVVKLCRIMRNDKLPGVPPVHDPQLEWCALYHNDSRRWYIYRQDDPEHASITL